MNYPKIMSEDATLDAALAGRSIARYGDGELKIILGANCISQVHDPKLAKELAEILRRSEALACIPNALHPDTKPAWQSYATPQYTRLYPNSTYGSSFITRPDSAPWIDRDDYWAKVNKLWEGHEVTLVLGTERSLRPDALPLAASVRQVWGSRRDAYSQIDQIEEEIGEPLGPVLLCLGPTATVLAHRLARKGVWGIDLGHIGMFMRHVGAFAKKLEELISAEYRQQNIEMHARPEGYGGSGWKQAGEVIRFADQINANGILDYGCGECTLGRDLRNRKYRLRVLEYDPGVEGKSGAPKPLDLVVCTDVLEHIEPDKLENVLNHILSLAGKAVYFVIATRPANKILPDGRNAHLIIESTDWWLDKLKSAGYRVKKVEDTPGHAVKVWCVK